MIKKYIIGFVASILLTMLAYLSVEYSWFDGGLLLAILAFLAITQAIVQLYYFLHLGEEQSREFD